MREKLDYITKIVEENNLMLKYLIKGIYRDDLDEFGRNILANIISTKLYNR